MAGKGSSSTTVAEQPPIGDKCPKCGSPRSSGIGLDVVALVETRGGHTSTDFLVNVVEYECGAARDGDEWLREDTAGCLRRQLAQVREDARETICGARRILADDALSAEAKVEKLKNHFSTARALLLIWEPAPPSVCKALEAAVEAHKEP